MGTPSKHLMIIAGEASGDMRAAGLARALRALDPCLRLSGVGGQHMREAGVECFADMTELAVIGIAEVLKNLGRIKKIFNHVLRRVEETRPQAVVLVDYPGFNLRLARALKARGIKTIYYISPQVWAWNEGRVKLIKKIVDRMIVLFPFEQKTYAKYGMAVDYVGHPLVDELMVRKPQTEVLKSLGLPAGKTTIGLMPGSREKEVTRHLPCMLAAAAKLHAQNHGRQFILLKAQTIDEEIIKNLMKGIDLPLKIYGGPTYDGINAMDAAIVASGTATLETALLGKPMVVIYKTSWLTYAIAKAVIKIPHISLVNVVAGKRVVEELIQNNATPTRIANSIETALAGHRLIEELTALKTSLGAPGASLRAAQIVLAAIS